MASAALLLKKLQKAGLTNIVVPGLGDVDDSYDAGEMDLLSSGKKLRAQRRDRIEDEMLKRREHEDKARRNVGKNPQEQQQVRQHLRALSFNPMTGDDTAANVGSPRSSNHHQNQQQVLHQESPRGAGTSAAAAAPSQVVTPRLPFNRKQFISFVVPNDYDEDNYLGAPVVPPPVALVKRPSSHRRRNKKKKGGGSGGGGGIGGGDHHRLHAVLAEKLQPEPLDRARSGEAASSLFPPVNKQNNSRNKEDEDGGFGGSGAVGGERRTRFRRRNSKNQRERPGWRIGSAVPSAPYEPSIMVGSRGHSIGPTEEGDSGGGEQRAQTAAIRHRRMLRPVDETGGGPRAQRVENETILQTYEALYKDEPPRDDNGDVIKDIPLQLMVGFRRVLLSLLFQFVLIFFVSLFPLSVWRSSPSPPPPETSSISTSYQSVFVDLCSITDLSSWNFPPSSPPPPQPQKPPPHQPQSINKTPTTLPLPTMRTTPTPTRPTRR